MAFSYHPYTKDAVRAVEFAHSKGARVVSITDNVLSPIADGIVGSIDFRSNRKLDWAVPQVRRTRM